MKHSLPVNPHIPSAALTEGVLCVGLGLSLKEAGSCPWSLLLQDLSLVREEDESLGL